MVTNKDKHKEGITLHTAGHDFPFITNHAGVQLRRVQCLVIRFKDTRETAALTSLPKSGRHKMTLRYWWGSTVSATGITSNKLSVTVLVKIFVLVLVLLILSIALTCRLPVPLRPPVSLRLSVMLRPPVSLRPSVPLRL